MSEANPNQPNAARRTAAARNARAGKRPTTRRVTTAKTTNEDQTSADQTGTPTQKPNPKVFLKKFCPVYVIKSRGDVTDCAICRNQLHEVCIRCQANGISDPSNCVVVEGVCGHKFHNHCISEWLKHSPRCPVGYCGLLWENA